PAYITQVISPFIASLSSRVAKMSRCDAYIRPPIIQEPNNPVFFDMFDSQIRAAGMGVILDGMGAIRQDDGLPSNNYLRHAAARGFRGHGRGVGVESIYLRNPKLDSAYLGNNFVLSGYTFVDDAIADPITWYDALNLPCEHIVYIQSNDAALLEAKAR